VIEPDFSPFSKHRRVTFETSSHDSWRVAGRTFHAFLGFMRFHQALSVEPNRTGPSGKAVFGIWMGVWMACSDSKKWTWVVVFLQKLFF
jgi:hypothetical protein